MPKHSRDDANCDSGRWGCRDLWRWECEGLFSPWKEVLDTSCWRSELKSFLPAQKLSLLKYPRYLANYLACNRSSEMFAELNDVFLPSKQWEIRQDFIRCFVFSINKSIDCPSNFVFFFFLIGIRHLYLVFKTLSQTFSQNIFWVAAVYQLLIKNGNGEQNRQSSTSSLLGWPLCPVNVIFE